MFFSEFDRAPAALNRGADRDDAGDPGVGRALQHLGEIRSEVRIVEVRVGIDQIKSIGLIGLSISEQALPLDHRARPGEPAAEDDHQDVIAGFDAAGAICFIERDGNGGSGGVPVAIQIHEKTLHRNFHPIGDRFDDADICLVRDDAGDVVDRQAGFIERFLRGIEHRDDGLLVNFLARHVDGLQVLMRVVPRDRLARTAARHPKDIGKFTVAPDMRADDAVCAAVAMLQDGGAGAVAEEDTGVAVGPIR